LSAAKPGICSVKKLAVLVYFIVLPYLSRIGGGIDWVAQYLSPDMLVFGLLFFGLFSAIPGFVLVALSTGSRRGSPLSLGIALLIMTVLTILSHYNYDLASDAQAAIWLVIAPLYIAACGMLAFFLVSAGEWLYRRVRHRGALEP
jgi:hypothetical protein